MKKIRLLTCVLVLLTMPFMSMTVFAQGSDGGGNTSAPFGNAFAGNAQGTKLYGTVSVELVGLTAGSVETLRAILRVRQGNELQAFAAEVSGIGIVDATPESFANAIFDEMVDEVLDGFFGSGHGLTGKLKSFDEVGFSPNPGNGFLYPVSVIDIVIAAK